MTLRGWIILDYLMDIKPRYRYPCKRGERQKALEERRQCDQTSEGWSDGTTSQERLQPHKLQRAMDGFPRRAFRESMALLTPHNVWPGKLILDFWFPEFGENTLLLFEATSGLQKLRTESFHVHLSKPAIIMLSTPASLTQDKPQIRQKRSLSLKRWKFWSGQQEKTNVQVVGLEGAVFKSAT